MDGKVSVFGCIVFRRSSSFMKGLNFGFIMSDEKLL